MNYKILLKKISHLRIPFKIAVFLFNCFLFILNYWSICIIWWDYGKYPGSDPYSDVLKGPSENYKKWALQIVGPESRWSFFGDIYDIIFIVLLIFLLIFFIISKERTLLKSFIFTAPNLFLWFMFYIHFNHYGNDLLIYLNGLIEKLFILVFHSNIPEH